MDFSSYLLASSIDQYYPFIRIMLHFRVFVVHIRVNLEAHFDYLTQAMIIAELVD